ncbi:hypothetical protein AVEN_184652-1 [Araneus ventricosus]|uniref:Uncharacterized protein n=1 Tax=Araneus ventricosus TaxID=182803 RepID=A0A4Y2SZU1_ARAVE|nr:hypothetical protein AVEN_16996-1 [Araneus ventricosus]GBN92796.1 hypothetical protein AVEN_58959-1 [Araneus ventricosus]GBN92815.1 hypothetical protein AVEN_184652-1 [Araneus ventricosus]
MFPEVQVNFHKIRPEILVCPQKSKSQSHSEEMQGGIQKSSRHHWLLSPEKQKSICITKPKSIFLSISPRLLIRLMVYRSTKLQKIADQHSSFLFHTSQRPVS